ncbi:hypothetical protein F2Q68_00016463 [Brassica cretica]|uniref:Uncharacterized protein n=1 Tax=Brassica cretica TaxID=69181 RepID=A0A8S9HKX2_BRACR|nr:hypothetical protein F2Q68_00016463 [Brassica cretica]
MGSSRSPAGNRDPVSPGRQQTTRNRSVRVASRRSGTRQFGSPAGDQESDSSDRPQVNTTHSVRVASMRSGRSLCRSRAGYRDTTCPGHQLVVGTRLVQVASRRPHLTDLMHSCLNLRNSLLRVSIKLSLVSSRSELPLKLSYMVRTRKLVDSSCGRGVYLFKHSYAD